MGWFQEVAANHVTGGLCVEGLGSLMRCNREKVDFKERSVFTMETADEEKFIFSVRF